MSGQIVDIPGLGRRVEIAVKYDYSAAPCKCPVCGGLGTPWNGWFSCEDCDAVALVGDGRTFVKVTGVHASSEQVNPAEGIK